jgi:hypothetical protein
MKTTEELPLPQTIINQWVELRNETINHINTLLLHIHSKQGRIEEKVSIGKYITTTLFYDQGTAYIKSPMNETSLTQLSNNDLVELYLELHHKHIGQPAK